MVICIIAITFFAGKIFISQWRYKKAEKEYEALEKKVQTRKGINWKELKRINKDIVAWIQIPGTGVDYPIVQGRDNQEYLHKTFQRKYNPSGCIFLDSKCKKDFSSDNNILYGHHMRDGSMFAELVKYKEVSFWKKHQKVYLYMPGKVKTLYVIAAKANKPEKIPIDFKDQKEKEEYQSKILTFSYLKDYKLNNTLFTLVTCSYEKDDYRTYIYAVEK